MNSRYSFAPGLALAALTTGFDIAIVAIAKDSLPLTLPAHGVVFFKFTAAK
jgi:hypothetical protein